MNLYVGNWGYDQIYVVDVDRDAVIDTLNGFRSVGNVTATTSGKKLYVTAMAYSVYPYDTTYPATVYSVDPATKLKKEILERRAMIYLEPNGTPLIIASSTMQDTAIESDTMRLVGAIDTVTDAVSFFDTLDIFHSKLSAAYEALVFDPNEPVLYTFTNQNQLFAYNYQEKRIIRYYTSLNLPYNIVISTDGKYIYCANGPVLDVANDSIIGWVQGNNESILGSLALTPDGKFLYLTDPGKPLLPEPVPSGKINFFQTNPFGYLGFIDVTKIDSEYFSTYYAITDRILITSDGKKAFVGLLYSDIVVIDLEINEAVNRIRFVPHNIVLRPLSLGVK